VEVADLCRREGIHPTPYYGWKKPWQSSGSKIFDEAGSKPSVWTALQASARLFAGLIRKSI
jgi:transposase-like protein